MQDETPSIPEETSLEDAAIEAPVYASPFLSVVPATTPADRACMAAGEGEPASADDTCVFCGNAIRFRCASRPSWCAERCGHSDCRIAMEQALA